MGSSARTIEEKEIAYGEVAGRRKASGFYPCPHRIILNSVQSSDFDYFKHNHIRGRSKNMMD